MKKSIERGTQRNELGWWSSWARSFRPARGATGLFSLEFPEPLFNRVLFLSPPRDPYQTVREIIRQFRSLGGPPSFFVLDSERFSLTRRAIGENGLRFKDRFLTLELVAPKLHRDRMTSVREASDLELEVWSRTYLESFYGNEVLLEEVLRSVRRSSLKRSNRLLLALRNGKVAGTMALHVSNGYTGVYCLGTVPSMRGKGIASSMLVAARDVASRLRTKVVLQVFEADKVEEFYVARGFRRVYAEEILGET